MNFFLAHYLHDQKRTSTQYSSTTNTFTDTFCQKLQMSISF